MNAAYKLDAKLGIQKIRQQAKWLQAEYADAAVSLLEGLEETGARQSTCRVIKRPEAGYCRRARPQR